MPAPFPIDEQLTAIAIGYKNKRFIADDVLPRVPVSKEEFKYRKYALADGFTIPDTKVGRTGRPNELEFGFTEETASTVDYALEDPIPMADMMNAPEGYDPAGHATEMLTNLIMLDREKRAADLVLASGTYASSNRTTLSGTSQWSDTTSNPLTAIMTALDSVVMRPNIAVWGRAVFTKVATHPAIVKAVHGNAGDSGVATAQQIANLLELEALYVGESWYNSAKRGQTASMARLWGKHAAFIYRDSLANTRSGTTFGFTAQFGDRVAGKWEDKNIGMRGGFRVRTGESVKEVVTANDLGYLFIDAVA
jgi:hypothetical protein